jgi:type III restriction enzyme
VAAVKESAAQSPDLFGEGGSPEEADIRKVLTTIAKHAERESISIPRVVVVPKDDVSFGYNDFEPKDLSQISYTPLEENIIVQEIRTGKRRPKIEASAALKETRPEDYILRAMLDHGDIDYDEHAQLLQKLTSAVVDHLRSYLPDDDAVEKVAYQFERPLAGRLVEQMRQHRWNSPTEYEARVTKGTATLKPLDFTAPSDAPLRPFSYKPSSKEELLRTLFTGFKRALYPIQKFHSDPERQFAEALEHSGQIMKWMKPARKQMQIEWGAGQYYEPDFVVETANEKWLVEIKMRKEMSAEDVVSKAEAAMKWCEQASTHESETGGKPWVYMLVPDDEVVGATPEKLRQTHARKVAKSEMTTAQ